MKCPSCKNDTLKHLHDVAHGLVGTHIKGSERFECVCGFICDNNEDAKKLDLKFIVDK